MSRLRSSRPASPGPLRPRLAWLCIALFAASPAHAASAPGREVPNFALLDVHGVNHEWQRTEAPIVVLFFTGNGCPIARKSAEKIRALDKTFADRGVQFWIVNAYPDDSASDFAQERGELKLHSFIALRDTKQAVALALGVERTAEVVVLKTRDGRAVYQGAIDDQYSEGAERPAPTQRYLESALRETLADQPVTTPRTRAHGCRLTYAKVGGPDNEVSYAAHVAPLLRAKCAECHRDGGIGPWAMDGFGRVRNNARMMEEVLLTRRMPTWDPHPDFGHFSNGSSLSREETQTLIRWIQAGAQRGDGPDPLALPMPPAPEWVLGTPDAIVKLPQPEVVPATGVLEYRHIRVSSPFTNDVWISGTDIKPSNRRVVHHAILYAKWPGSGDDGTGNGVFFCGWAPGTPASKLPQGAAKRLPAGAELTLEMHYTTCGSEQTDQTEVALYLAPGPQPYAVEVRAVVEPDIHIPPGTDEARHTAVLPFTKPTVLYTLSPHMHVRGKWMKYELLLPDGSRETLLYVPRYDFQWQHTYKLAEPRQVPAGSWLWVTAAYDNSSQHPGNPAPRKRVTFGKQSWDEMFFGFFEAADVPSNPPAAKSTTTASVRF